MSAHPRDLDLGVIGNSEVAALIDREATIVWACLPRLDGDPVFCALLDSDRDPGAQGLFAIELVDCAEVTQRYLRNTAILETTMSDVHGNRLRIVDFCPRFRARGRIFRPAMVIRMIEPIAGRPMVRVRVRPRFEHGELAAEVVRGSHHIAYRGRSHGFRITTNCSLSAIADEAPCVVDRPLALILGPDQAVEESPQALAADFLDKTLEYWDDWVRGLAIPFEWQDAVIRAAISLKLCTYEDTGAVLAALTTSVPESAGSGRNWDYRYCWLRDSYFVIQALNRLGATRTMEGYLRFIDRIVASCAERDIAPLYSVSGEREVTERIVPPMRTGPMPL